MAVAMKRSTKMAPVSLSTSYLIGSEWAEISMMTLISSGTFLPAGTSFRAMSLPAGLHARFTCVGYMRLLAAQAAGGWRRDRLGRKRARIIAALLHCDKARLAIKARSLKPFLANFLHHGSI